MRATFRWLWIPLLLTFVAAPSRGEEPILCALEHPRPGFIIDYFAFVHLTVSKNGSLRWNDAPINGADFSNYLLNVAEADPKPTFTFKVEPGTTYQAVVPTLTKVQNSGVRWMFLGAVDKQNTYIRCEVVDHWANSMPVIVNVNVKADGRLFWNGTIVNRQTFTEYLVQAARMSPQPLIDIWPEPDTPYEALMSILSDIYAAEIRDTAFGPYGRWIEEKHSKAD